MSVVLNLSIVKRLRPFTFLRCETGAGAGGQRGRSSATQCRRTPVPKTARKRKRKAWPPSNGADRPDPFRLKSWRRSEANRSSSILRSSDIRRRLSPKRCRLQKVRAVNGVRLGGQISPDSATDDFDVRTFSFRFRPSSLARLALESADFLRCDRVRINPINFLIFAECFACFSRRGERLRSLQMGLGFVL